MTGAFWDVLKLLLNLPSLDRCGIFARTSSRSAHMCSILKMWFYKSGRYTVLSGCNMRAVLLMVVM